MNPSTAIDISSGEPVKVLHVYPRLICGGVERVIEDILRFSDRALFRFDILTQEEGDNEAVFSELGAGILRVPFTGDTITYRTAVREILERGGYDAVHCHSHREMSLVNMEAESLGIPVRIAHSHNAHQDIQGFRRMARWLKFRRHARGATDLVGCSRDALDWMFPYGGPRRKIITNGISSRRFRFDRMVRDRIRKENGIADGTQVILNVGRASEQKNQLHILRMAKADRNGGRLYVIIGDGPLLDSLNHNVERDGLSNVLLLGERRDTQDWLSAADIFLFPSIFEGHPLAPMEAQAAGLPVLASEAIPEEARVIPGLFQKVRGWDTASWLESLDAIAMADRSRERQVDFPAEYESSEVARRFCGLYAPARMFFCHPAAPAWITGGDRYNLRFAHAATKALGSEVRMLVADDLTPTSYANRAKPAPTGPAAGIGKIIRKMMLPGLCLRMIRRTLKDYRKKGWPAPAFLFNTSKCVYFLPALIYLRMQGAVAVGITHHPLYIQMKGLKRSFYRWMELRFIRGLDYSVVPSRFTLRTLLREIPELRPTFIPIPFDIRKPLNEMAETTSESSGNEEKSAADEKKHLKYKDNSGKKCKFADDCVELLFVGTVEPRKGLNYLFKSMRLLQNEGLNVDLKVVGKETDPNHSDSLRAMAAKWNLSVSWEGYLPDDRKSEFLEKADIFVLPSEAEGFGIVLVEAMMAGTPVVAFRNSGMVDVIGSEEERGLLAANRDPRSLADAIRRIAADPGLRAEKVRNAQEWTRRLTSCEDFEREVSDLCGSIWQS